MESERQEVSTNRHRDTELEAQIDAAKDWWRLTTVGMYDLIGHFVYLKLYGGFSYEGGRKRNKAQAAGSKPCG